MLKIRLMRIGGKQRPFYRVVVVEGRSKRTGSYVELLGTYNPLTEPKEIKLNEERIAYWIKQGAQPSTGYLRIIGKAPQRPPRKAKKEKKEEPKVAPVIKSVAETPSTEEPAKSENVVPVEEPKQEETPAPKEAVKEEVVIESTESETKTEEKKDEGTA